MKWVSNLLLWLIPAQLGRQRRHGRLIRVTIWALLVSAVVLWVIPTQQFNRAMERIWSLPDANILDFRPTYLIVLAGGWRPGKVPSEDRLLPETRRRVLHAAALWRRHPESRLIMSGWSGEFAASRHIARQVELMAEAARHQGVRATSIILEPRAVNTFGHPNEVLKLARITAGTRVGIVTSGRHMRRAYVEFCKQFEHVAPYSVPQMRAVYSWDSFIPTAEALRDTRVIFREIVGLSWYWFRETSHGRKTASKCRPLRNDGPESGSA